MKLFIMNRYISKNYTTIKNTTDDNIQSGAGAAVVSTITCRDIVRLTVKGDHLERWQPVTHSARSRRYYAKIGDCEQSIY